LRCTHERDLVGQGEADATALIKEVDYADVLPVGKLPGSTVICNRNPPTSQMRGNTYIALERMGNQGATGRILRRPLKQAITSR
jgi:hypothetical protein